MSFVKHIFNKESPDQIKIADIQKLVENETEESLHLEYERIPEKHVKYDGLAEHLSGFLNTSGGIVVFGLSERKKEGRNVPDSITWTTVKKEWVETGLFQKISPWCEDIQICPIQNPSDDTQRIFLIDVSKSKNPPHMANHRYYIRLNFQTQPMGHEQVLEKFRQNYFQKYELISTVYNPIFNELSSFYNQKMINRWNIEKYEQVRKERMFLLQQDVDLYLQLDNFYQRISKWNQAVDHAPYRLAEIINDLASDFFSKPLPPLSQYSAFRLEIRARSIHHFPPIDEAILNRTDPIDFWKAKYPFDRSLEIKIHLQHTYGMSAGKVTTMIVQEKQFREFMEKVREELRKDELIQYIWKEFDEMQTYIEILRDELGSRM